MSDFPAGSGPTLVAEPKPQKKDADYVFYELTRSICPECRKVIDAKILLRDNKVYIGEAVPGPWAVRGARLWRRRNVPEL